MAVSGDSFGCHKGHLAVEAREAAIHPTRHRTTPLKHRVSWPKVPPRAEAEKSCSRPIQAGIILS